MSKQMNNREVAELLRSVAAAYELKPGSRQGRASLASLRSGPSAGANNRFRISAYQKAADAIEHVTRELKDIWEEGKLDEVPGVGTAIAGYLDELFKTGQVKHFKQVFSSLPPAMFSLLVIPGIGAKTAYKLTKELNLAGKKTIEELEKAAKSGKIQEIEGFGVESERDILRSIEEFRGRIMRMLLPYASQISEEVVIWLKKHPAVERVDSLGSLRRQVATVGDVDIAVASKKPKEVIKHFTKYPKKSRVLEAGERTSSFLLPGGEQVDLMVQPPESYGSLLQHFTGSKQHNIALRELALKKGLSLSEYGIKRGNKLVTYASEEDFYRALGIDWIPPELREDNGEIEAAQTGKLPRLVELSDIKGDFHLHSNFPIKTSHDEGMASFGEMLRLAEELGYEYLGFSEHNPSQSGNTKKQVLDLLKRKQEVIEKLNYSREKTDNKRVNKVFNGLEIDIKPNGELAVPNEGLELLDFAIVSVHSSFRQSKKEQTKRVIAGLSHPKAKILGHPTARRLNQREEIELDWEVIFDFCQKKNKWLEINSWYDRLDLPDKLVREAVKNNVLMIINTDSHELEHMRIMRHGISVARRGWAQKDDIVNTKSYNEFIKKFQM